MAVVKSVRFASDPAVFTTTSQVLSGFLRLGPAGTDGVLSDGLAIAQVQQALINVGFNIPSGPTGHFGTETADAVTNFKSFWHLSPTDPIIGRFTMSALDYEMLQQE